MDAFDFDSDILSRFVVAELDADVDNGRDDCDLSGSDIIEVVVVDDDADECERRRTLLYLNEHGSDVYSKVDLSSKIG